MDKERILNKIRELESYKEEIYEVLPDSIDIYLNSIEKKRAIERILQIMIECVIDICFLMNKELHIGPPPTESSVFHLLNKHLSNVKVLKDMKGFRNILVHRYGFVNNELVFQYANERIEDFEIFIKDIERMLS